MSKVVFARRIDRGSMGNGAIADVVIEGVRGVVPAQVETVRSGAPADRWRTSTHGDRATRVADETATVVTTELVVELGETNLWVSVDHDGTTSRPELVKGAEPGQFPAALRVTEAGRWFWGAGHRLRDGDLLVSNVLARVDDPVPVIIGRKGFDGAELVARQVATLFRLAKPSAPARLTLVHPVDLSRRGREAVEHHLSRRLPPGTSVEWTSRAAAAVAATPECADLETGDRVGVLHVGGASVEAAVWRQTGPSAGDVGEARVDRGGAGHAVDDVLLGALTQGTGFGRSAGQSNVDVPALHRECERAKAALSAETAVDVDVEGVPVRMVRGDVEDLSAPLVMSSSTPWVPRSLGPTRRGRRCG